MAEVTESQFFARFESAFNQTQQLHSDVATLKANVDGIQSDLIAVSKNFTDLSNTVGRSLETLSTKMEANTASLLARIETRTTPNYLAYGLVVPLIIALIGAAWAVISSTTNSQIALAVSPIPALTEEAHRNTQAIADIAQRVQGSIGADAESRTDRGQLNSRVKAIEVAQAADVAERKSKDASIDGKLIEVETQFRKDADLNNLRFAHVERDFALSWNSLHQSGPPWPTEPFFYPKGDQ